MEIIVIPVWLICGIVAALIYQSKGRSGVSGCLGGVILGPIGLLLAIASSDARRKCPHCAERIQKDAKVCPHCQRDVTEISTQ